MFSKILKKISPFWVELLVGIGFFIYGLVIYPLGNFAYDDDFAYLTTALNFFDTHRMVVEPWSFASLVAQVWWGQLFLSLFGKSIASLHLSTLVLHGIASFFLLGIVKTFTKSRSLQGLVVVTYAFSPIVLDYASSFLTEIPSNSFIIIGLYFFIKAFTNKRFWFFAIAGVMLAAATLVRQSSVFVIIAMEIALFVRKTPLPKKLYQLLFFTSPIILTIVPYLWWLGHGGKTQAQYLLGDIGVMKGRLPYIIPYMKSLRQSSELYFESFNRAVRMFTGVGILMIPFVPLLWFGVKNRLKIFSIGVVVMVGIFFLNFLDAKTFHFNFYSHASLILISDIFRNHFLTARIFPVGLPLLAIGGFMISFLFLTITLRLRDIPYPLRLFVPIIFLGGTFLGVRAWFNPYLQEHWFIFLVPGILSIVFGLAVAWITRYRDNTPMLVSLLSLLGIMVLQPLISYHFWPSYLLMALPFIVLMAAQLFSGIHISPKLVTVLIGGIMFFGIETASLRYNSDKIYWKAAETVLALDPTIEPHDISLEKYAWLPWWYAKEGQYEAIALYGNLFNTSQVTLLPGRLNAQKPPRYKISESLDLHNQEQLISIKEFSFHSLLVHKKVYVIKE